MDVRSTYEWEYCSSKFGNLRLCNWNHTEHTYFGDKFLNQILWKIIRGVFVGKLKISHHSYCSHKMLATLIILLHTERLSNMNFAKSIAHQDFSVTYDYLTQHPTTKIEIADARSSDPSKDPDSFFIHWTLTTNFCTYLFCNNRIRQWNNFSFYDLSEEYSKAVF